MFDFAVASDLQRANDTARAIVGERVPVMLDARWREFYFGEWEGLTWDEIIERWPEYSQRNPFSVATYQPEGGESFADVRARVSLALDDLRTAQHRNILVATHAGPLHAMLSVLFPGERDVCFMPASITRVRSTGGATELVSLNETGHLAV